MLSRLLTGPQLALQPFVKPTVVRVLGKHNLANATQKRWSGHNAMRIEPSSWAWRYYKDMSHFWIMIAIIPMAVVTTIINIRANPELTEIPEGYEPRHWEYFKHPVARFLAKYFYYPPELEDELKLSLLEMESETLITKKIERRVNQVMKFYNDHRSRYFRPFYADYVRIGRDQVFYGMQHHKSNENTMLEDAYDPQLNPVPTEGYKSGQMP